MSTLKEYLEAIYHDPPPVGRKEWEASKVKKLKEERKKEEAKELKQKERDDREDRKSQARSDILRNRYEKLIVKIEKRYQLMGSDLMREMAGDKINSKKFTSKEDLIDDLTQLAQDIASDSEIDISDKEMRILKTEIRDIKGRLLDEIHEGALNFLKSKQFNDILQKAGIK